MKRWTSQVRHDADRLLRRSRRHRLLITAAAICVDAVVGAVVLAFLPHRWINVGPVIGVWVLSIGAFWALFGPRNSLSVIAAAIGAGAAIGVPYKWVVEEKIAVHGFVECASGAGVMGVFVRAVDGESGFAGWSPVERESRARYSLTLRHETKVRLGVGCGGDTQNWRADLVTPYFKGGRADFICRDRNAYGRVFGRCRRRE